MLVLDSDELFGRQVKSILGGANRQVFTCLSAREAIVMLTDMVPDLLIVSLDLPDLTGPRILDLLRERAPKVPIIATSSQSDVDLAVTVLRTGAVDVKVKPIQPGQLEEASDRALTEARGNRELAVAREQQRDRHGFSHLLTQSPRMLRVFDQIRSVAGTDATVLIRGETGTGKELVSRAIHERSARREEPFISVNCGAFTESLLESELFGHERGSFTGASDQRRGVFEMANGGTLFLDELGETSLNVQVNLLRVLEEMSFRRVGGHKLVHVDVRIVAATNVHLEEAVSKKQFREDLFYRLNVFPIAIPPLRQRPEDIPLLTRHFLEDAAGEYTVEPPTITPEAMQSILTYRWPGNVRQLRSLCERWVIVAHGGQVTPDMLPAEMQEGQPLTASPMVSVDLGLTLPAAVEQAVGELERRYLHRLLDQNKGHLGRTAAAAGITRRTLYNKLKAYGLDATDYR
ncbi:MAG: sigma-54 dependent transcriptional regulator [Myxococcota bacterium]|nr:sigma-54 dependent transcriptional regulator [Myxococcota bacterium]